MIVIKNFCWVLSLTCLPVVLTGCSTFSGQSHLPPDAPTQLTAVLTSPLDIELNWRAPATPAAGQIVEFATERNGTYTILDFIPANQTSFKHSDLMPGQPYFYRVRGYYGPLSNPITVTVPSAPTGGFGWDAAKEPTRAVRKSVRKPFANSDAAPTDLGAVVNNSDPEIKVSWIDHARDEDGYLLEIAPPGSPDFKPSGILQPDITVCRLHGLAPPGTSLSMRVRALFYGTPSNLVRLVPGEKTLRTSP